MNLSYFQHVSENLFHNKLLDNVRHPGLPSVSASALSCTVDCSGDMCTAGFLLPLDNIRDNKLTIKK